MITTHTDALNAILKATAKPKKERNKKPIECKQIEALENMTPLQESLSKCIIAGSNVMLPKEKIDNYPELRKALINAGAQYKKNSFVFPSDASPIIDMLMSGGKVNIKKEFQYFGTPLNVAEQVAAKITFFKGAKLCEPSAGQGGLLAALPTNMNLDITCIELMPANAEVLRKKGYSVRCEDFLKNKYEQFDIIIANPPFSKNQDIDHFMHMWKHLKKNGQMAVITSPHWTFASDKKSKEFRIFLDANGAEWEEINEGEFKESGTNIKTILITIDK